MKTANLVQYYVLESYSRAEAIKGQCEHLLTCEYASEAPKNLAKAIINLCGFLQGVGIFIYNDMEEGLSGVTVEEIENELIQLKYLDKWITHIGEHVQYIDSARSHRVPWSIIPAFEDFADNLIGDVEVMFCPLWEYNYQINLLDIKSHFQRCIEFFKIIPGVSADAEIDVLASLKKPFHIIRFPSPERLNIRLHTNFGHELGHKLADIFFSQERKDRFGSSIFNKVKECVEMQVQTGELAKEPILRSYYNQTYLEKAYRIWQRALEEILSDITACILFGPAALFSMYDFALQDELDHLPKEEFNFYPPWRMRLRNAVYLLEEKTDKFFPVPKSVIAGTSIEMGKAATDYFNFIKSLTISDKDIQCINTDPLAKLVYDDLKKWIDEGVDFLLNEQSLAIKKLTPGKLLEKLPHLIDRLENSIIPNALELSADNRVPANFAEIVNAAWFCWLSQAESPVSIDGKFNIDVYKKRIRMNNLCLKAVEYAHLEQCYRQKIMGV